MTYPLSQVTNVLFMLITIYSFISDKSDNSDKVKLVTSLENEVKSVFNRDKAFLVNFNASEAKLLSFNDHREPSLPSVIRADANCQERNSALSWAHVFPWHVVELYGFTW